VSTKFRESGNSFLLMFSNDANSTIFSIVQIFNCFLFKDDGIHSLSIENIFIKEPGVFVSEFCARHGIDSTNCIELNIMVKDQEIEPHIVKSIIVGCERMAFTRKVPNSSSFWEL